MDRGTIRYIRPQDGSGSLREPLLDRGAIHYIRPQDGRGSLREPSLDRGTIHYIRPQDGSGSLREPLLDRGAIRYIRPVLESEGAFPDAFSRKFGTIDPDRNASIVTGLCHGSTW